METPDEGYELRIDLSIHHKREYANSFRLSQTIPLGSKDLRSMVTIMAGLEDALKSIEAK